MTQDEYTSTPTTRDQAHYLVSPSAAVKIRTLDLRNIPQDTKDFRDQLFDIFT